MNPDNFIDLIHLPVNTDDQRWGTVVYSLGAQEIAPGMPYPPKDHPTRYVFSEEKGRILDEYQLIYVPKGSGRFTSKMLLGKWVNIVPGSMFLLFPGEWHSYRPDNRVGWQEYWIGFSGPNIANLIKNGFFSEANPVLRVGVHEEIIDLYRKAFEVAEKQEAGFQHLLGSITDHLLAYADFYAANESFRESGAFDVVKKAKDIIAEKYATISPEGVAEELGMGYSNFRKIFRAYTGFSPAKYINHVRFAKTKDALTNSKMTIKEISAAMGFENYEYFFTAFRRYAGVTPVEYRKRTRGKRL